MSRTRYLLVGLLVSAVVVLALAPVATAWMLSRPFLGLSVTRVATEVVVTAVAPGSSAAAVGLGPGDRLLSVGDVERRASAGPHLGSAFLLDVINRYSAGTTVRWEWQRGDTVFTASRELASVPSRSFSAQILVVIGFWILAAFLVFIRPKDPVVLLLGLGVVANTAGQFFRPVIQLELTSWIAVILYQVCALGRFLGPALVVHFGLVFPARTLARRTYRSIIALAYGITGTLFLVEQGVLFRGIFSDAVPYAVYGQLLQSLRYWDIRYAVYLACFLASGLLMLTSLLRLRNAKARAQIKWVMWGILLTAATEALIVGLARFGGTYWDELIQPYIDLSYLFLATGLVIAILRYDLFDVDIVIRRTAVYFMTMAVVFVIFTGGETLISDAFRGFLPNASSMSASIVSGVVAALLFMPLRRLADRLVSAVVPKHDKGAGAMVPNRPWLR